MSFYGDFWKDTHVRADWELLMTKAASNEVEEEGLNPNMFAPDWHNAALIFASVTCNASFSLCCLKNIIV